MLHICLVCVVCYMSCMYSFAGELGWMAGKEKAGSEQCLQGFQVSAVDPEGGKVFSRHLERGGWSLGNPGRELSGL